VIANAHWDAKRVLLSEPGGVRRWRRVIDTSLEDGHDIAAEGAESILDPQDHYLANGRSTIVLLARA